MTEIVCKCGTSRIEDVQCAECGEYFKAGWIPVSERLPKQAQHVIVNIPGMGFDIALYVICKQLPFDGFHAGGIKLVGVTHWMPLPPPPEAS